MSDGATKHPFGSRVLGAIVTAVSNLNPLDFQLAYSELAGALQVEITNNPDPWGYRKQSKLSSTTGALYFDVSKYTKYRVFVSLSSTGTYTLGTTADKDDTVADSAKTFPTLVSNQIEAEITNTLAASYTANLDFEIKGGHAALKVNITANGGDIYVQVFGVR